MMDDVPGDIEHGTDGVFVEMKRSIKCDQCEYFSMHKGALRMHMNKHNEKRPLECNKCEYTTIKKRSLE